VSRPNLPTSKQVAAVQDFINKQQGFNFRLLVQRVSIDVIGPEAAPNPEPVSVEEAVPKAQPARSPQPASITADQPQADNKPPLADN
jgi:hypothetical protein